MNLMEYYHTHHQRSYRMEFQLFNICDPDMARDYIISNREIFSVLKYNSSEMVKKVIEKLELEAYVPR